MSRLIASLVLLLSFAVASVSQSLFGFDVSDLARLFHTEPLYTFLQAWPMKYKGVG